MILRLPAVAYQIICHSATTCLLLKRFALSCLLLLVSFLAVHRASAQCTPASINWDWQYKVGAFTSPATFGIGVNAMAMSWDAGVTAAAPAVNNAFTGYGTGGYGDGLLAQFDLQNGWITFTFRAEVENVQFAVYGIDSKQGLTVTAADGAAAPNARMVAMTPANSPSDVRVTGSNSFSATASGPNGKAKEEASGVNVDIAGPVKSITLTFTRSSNGTDPIWISDIKACVTGNYGSGYAAVSVPEAGQPTYLLAVERNNVYAINTGSAQATLLFTDAAAQTGGINSLAYDPNNQVFYYSNGQGSTTNKAIYKYDLKTCTRSTFIADVTASPFLIPLNSQGVGGGGAAFYNGSLFFGIDAGTAVTEDNAIWRIDPDAAGQAVSAARVFSVQANDGNTSLFNWGDFGIYDGTLYNFNSALSPAPNTGVIHYNLNAQQQTAGYALTGTSQLALSYEGTVYNVNDGIAQYNKAGALGAKTTISGGGWPAGATATDGAAAFKFPADFGDAPASYGRPFHQFTSCAAATGLLQLGASVDFELAPVAGTAAAGDNSNNYGGSGTSNDEDALSSFPALALTSTGSTAAYTLTVAVRNTTGATRTLQGWIDFDGDGLFAAGEYASAAVAVNATTASLTWAPRAAGITKAGNTYARFRITATALTDNAATPAVDERATAAAFNGEVEDHALAITLSLSGTVFRDANGLADNLVNGTGLGTAGNTALYAYLVAGSLVADKVSPGSNGTYTFSKASANTAYTVLVTTANAAVGAAAPAVTLPAGWVSVGEAVAAATDAPTNSVLALSTGTSSIGDINFGLQQLPASQGAEYAIMKPVGNTPVTLTADQGLGALSGLDPEDGALGAGGQVVITSLAAMEGNELYYNNVLLQAGSVIQNYMPGQLAIKANSSPSNGAAFDFAFRDAAGYQSAAPATYSISWSTLLPLTLISFELKKNSRQVLLHWATAMEENTRVFLVEHSRDGKNWTLIGSRPAAGTSLAKRSYSFADPNPKPGDNLYRLKMLDLDGSFTYSPVKALYLEAVMDIRCYPNPVADKLYITDLKEGCQVRLCDARGNLVFAAKALPLGFIDMQQLPAGMYLLQITGPDAPVKTLKVVRK